MPDGLNRLNRDRDGGGDLATDLTNKTPQTIDPRRPRRRSHQRFGDGSFRSIDGSKQQYSKKHRVRFTDSELLRATDSHRPNADGISEPAGADRPSAREISNVLSAADSGGHEPVHRY